MTSVPQGQPHRSGAICGTPWTGQTCHLMKCPSCPLFVSVKVLQRSVKIVWLLPCRVICGLYILIQQVLCENIWTYAFFSFRWPSYKQEGRWMLADMFYSHFFGTACHVEVKTSELAHVTKQWSKCNLNIKFKSIIICYKHNLFTLLLVTEISNNNYCYYHHPHEKEPHGYRSKPGYTCESASKVFFFIKNKYIHYWRLEWSGTSTKGRAIGFDIPVLRFSATGGIIRALAGTVLTPSMTRGSRCLALISASLPCKGEGFHDIFSVFWCVLMFKKIQYGPCLENNIYIYICVQICCKYILLSSGQHERLCQLSFVLGWIFIEPSN